MSAARMDVAVIGGGPAGLAAARAAAEVGADTCVIDLGAEPGGQYWMQETAHLGPTPSVQSRDGARAAALAREAGVVFHGQAELWAIFPDESGFRLCFQTPEGGREILARRLVAATGAHDRVMPFPGWTLPGVMTPGAAQRLVKLGATPPGRAILLAGSGPFLLAVAKTLGRLDAAPKLLVEARRPGAAIAAHLARFPERWGEAVRLLGAMPARPRRRFGYVVTEALGETWVEAARIAPIAPDGRVDHAKTEIVNGIDCLAVGWGFRPSIEVTVLLRCDHAYDAALGGWHCVIDQATGETSVAGVYAAGEVTGVAGMRPALHAGRRAGQAAARSLGLAVSAPARSLSRRAARDRAFAEGIMRLYSPPPLGALLQQDETIACRCEEVRCGTIRASLEAGTGRVQGAKLWSRAGMGACQGRICGWAVAELAAAAQGLPVDAMGFNAPRIPLRPVPLSTVHETLSRVTG